MTKVPLPDGLAEELRRWRLECKRLDRRNLEHAKALPDAFIFPNSDGGFIDTANYRFRVLNPLPKSWGFPN